MRLIENVHYVRGDVALGEMIPARGNGFLHFADFYNGVATFLFKIDPDISDIDVIKHGQQLRRERLASSPKRRTIARRRPKR